MRKINDHKVNGANDALEISVLDEPGAGGANHHYEISGVNLKTNPSAHGATADGAVDIFFQNGTIPENGTNGVTQEALIAIVCDQLRSFQAGPFASRYNTIALTKLEEAQMWLQKRTQDRLQRGVEGTHQK